MNRKALEASLTLDKGEFVATISTDSIDRDGEVLIPQGMDATEFQKNPVVFWNHDYDRPVGRSVELKRGERTVIARTKFADRPPDFVGDFFPDFARALVEQGVIKGVSVGFIAKPDGVRTANQQDMQKFGPDVRRVFSKWSLLEYSLAPLQANQDALISAVGKNFSPESIEKWTGIKAPRRRRSIILLDEKAAPAVNVDAIAAQAASIAVLRRKGRMFA